MGERRGTKALELWCRRMTAGYSGVKIENMTTSWRDGLAFCAIIHHFRPDLIDFDKLDKNDVFYNNELAFRTAEIHLGIPALLDASDMESHDVPDRLSILTYLSQYYQVFGAQDASTQSNNRRSIAEGSNAIDTKTSDSPKMLSRGVLRREPCFKCDLPVFLAEKLTIDGRMYHRTCLKCARCGHQLTPGSFYETEVDAEFCCEVCPDEEKRMSRDEEKSALKEVPLGEEEMPSEMERQNSLLKKSLSDEAKRESLERMKGKDQQKGMLSFIETQFEDLEVGVSVESVKTETLNAQGAESDIISDDDELKGKGNVIKLLDPPVDGGIDSETSVDDKLSKLVLDDKEPTPREVISSPEIPCVTKDDEIVANDEPIVPDQEEKEDQEMKEEEANVPACNTSVVIQVPIVDVKSDVSSSAALQSADDDESSDVVPEQPKVETYPNKLNPFDSEDEDDEPEAGGKEQKLNPFDSDDDEIEAEKMKREQKSSNNPFEDDASDDEAKNQQSIAKPSPRRTPVPTPRKTVMKTPNQQYLLVSPGAIPKDLYGSTASLNSRNESHGSMNSLSSTSTAGGMTMARHKKGKAPLPPSAEKSPIGSQLSTPKSSPRSRKKRPAPAPPIPTKSPDTRRRLIPLDSELLTEMEVKGEEQSLQDVSEISYRRKIMPLEASDTEERESESHERQWEKLKDNKESKNRNRRSHIYQGEEIDGVYGDKSAHGKWKKRKGPAPALPVPPKRVLRMLPLQDILHELEVIEVQQQGLEKQGITLEKIIRERCEGAEETPPKEEDVLSRDSLARLPTQNTKEVEDLIMQLFDLVNEKNELFRRQAELMYLRRQHRLEQEQIDLEYEIRVMMAQPERNKTDSDKAKEEAMISRLVEVVQLRNDVVDNLEMDRLREAEEDLSIKQEIEKHTAKRDESFREEDVTTKLSKKEKKKQKEAKKLKNKKIDIDKDDDETESSGNVVRKKKKKFIII